MTVLFRMVGAAIYKHESTVTIHLERLAMPVLVQYVFGDVVDGISNIALVQDPVPSLHVPTCLR